MPEEFMKYFDELIELRAMKSELLRYLNNDSYPIIEEVRDIVGLPKKREDKK